MGEREKVKVCVCVREREKERKRENMLKERLKCTLSLGKIFDKMG